MFICFAYMPFFNSTYPCGIKIMNITPGLPFLNIHNPFTNERISIYLDKHSRMSLDTNDYFVKQIRHLSKGVVMVALALCQLMFALLLYN